ncbi:unnamed protein product [Effrenium voratum]|nr:unnamed protein product [Effrenium voratum]CAJ1456309.1 unnamed protein product [Effrenium voratum]
MMQRRGPLARLVVASLALAFSSSQLLCFGACKPGICATGTGELTGGASAASAEGRALQGRQPRDWLKWRTWRQAVPADSTSVKQALHVGRYITMWKARWIGPENLDRAGLRVTGMDTYALVAAVLLQVLMGLYGSVPEPDELDERLKYPQLHRFMYEAQMIFASISVICSTYTMVMFLLCKIYSVMALGMWKDVSYDLFQQATGRFRLRAFWSLIIAMHSFLVSFAMNLFTRIKGNRGLFLFMITMLGLIPVVCDWTVIYRVAEQYVYA